MNGNEKEGYRPSRKPAKERIDTQIHRRRTVKALSPLKLEWESSPAEPSARIVMRKAKEIRRLMPDRELEHERNPSPCSPLPDHHT